MKLTTMYALILRLNPIKILKINQLKNLMGSNEITI